MTIPEGFRLCSCGRFTAAAAFCGKCGNWLSALVPVAPAKDDESAVLCSCGAGRYSAACSLKPEHPHVKPLVPVAPVVEAPNAHCRPGCTCAICADVAIEAEMTRLRAALATAEQRAAAAEGKLARIGAMQPHLPACKRFCAQCELWLRIADILREGTDQ